MCDVCERRIRARENQQCRAGSRLTCRNVPGFAAQLQGVRRSRGRICRLSLGGAGRRSSGWAGPGGGPGSCCRGDTRGGLSRIRRAADLPVARGVHQGAVPAHQLAKGRLVPGLGIPLEEGFVVSVVHGFNLYASGQGQNRTARWVSGNSGA